MTHSTPGDKNFKMPDKKSNESMKKKQNMHHTRLCCMCACKRDRDYDLSFVFSSCVQFNAVCWAFSFFDRFLCVYVVFFCFSTLFCLRNDKKNVFGKITMNQMRSVQQYSAYFKCALSLSLFLLHTHIFSRK